MKRNLAGAFVGAVLCVSACGDDGPGPAVSWNSVGSAFWIGMTDLGSPPVVLFLLEKRVECPDISFFNWDDTIGETRLLEIGLREAAVRTFDVPLDANVAYLKGFYNPDADMGTVTIKEINPSTNIVGSFDANYMRIAATPGPYQADRIRGTFDAKFCPTGVEP